VIYNSNVGKTIVEKNTDSLKKLAVAANKLLIDRQKSAIGYEKSAIEQQKYNEPTKANIIKVYNEIEKKQIFGTKEIEVILGCSSSTARAVMAKLRDMNVVTVVKGKGKGKYIFTE
jgi:ATP-dependent DNA helicase RecG